MLLLKKRGPVRLELSPAAADAPAVAVTIRPIGQADIDVATAAITSAVVKSEDASTALARYGVAVEEAGAADVLRLAIRMGDAMLAIELGIRHIVSWEGIGLEDGTPAPVEPATVALLFNEWAPEDPARKYPRESYASRFMRCIGSLSILEPGAKKGSGVSPDGASGGAPITASAAGKTATRAPPESA